MKHWISRIIALIAIPSVVWLATQGNEAAANALPFLAWLSAFITFLAFVAVALLDADKLAATRAAVAPRWYRRIDLTVDWLIIGLLSAHGWYWTATAFVAASAWGAMYRHALITKVDGETEVAS